MKKLLWTSVALGALGSAFAACSAAQETNQFPTSGSTTGSGAGGGQSTTTTSNSGGEIGFTTTANTNTGGSGNTGGSCAGETNKAEQIPLDMYLMLDSSGSMSDIGNIFTFQTKWQAVTSALGAFYNDPKSAGVGVGIQHFAIRDPNIPASCTVDADCASNGSSCMLKSCVVQSSSGSYLITPCQTNADCAQYGSSCVDLGTCDPTDPMNNLCFVSGGPNFCKAPAKCTTLTTSRCSSEITCDAADYAVPAVEIAALPGNAAALGGTMAGWSPDGMTPTGPALTGAIQHAQAWAAQNPTHAVIVVLATDGMPTECQPQDIPSIAGIAAQGNSGAQPVKTFTIGVFSPGDIFSGAQLNLDAIAAAGGTTKAFVVDTTQDVEAQFQAALDAIRSSKLACEFKVPAPGDAGALDYDKVNVKYTPPGKPAQTIGYVVGAATCDPAKGGWYYDFDPAGGGVPTKIIMCPATCDAFGKLTGGEVDIEVGCQTVHQPPPA